MAWFGYNSWSLRSQLKVSFLLPSLLVCIGLLLITKYQLSSLEDKISLNYTSSLIVSITSQMTELGLEESEYLSAELSSFIQFNKQFALVDSMILGLSDIPIPTLPGTPVQDTIYSLTDNDYTTGCFMTSYPTLSPAGIELEAKESAMDKIYPLYEASSYLFIYTGFEIDEIIHYYPGSITSDRSYSPVVREWYYRAKDNPNTTQITEPYQDSGTFEWVVTVSRAILDKTGEVYGVAACDITLVELTTKTSSITILENGFAMLVSSGGMILTLPVEWNLDVSAVYQVFEESITGISEDLWNNVTGSDDGTVFEISKNTTNYMFMKFSIDPFTDYDKVTHYLLIFADKDEVVRPVTAFTYSFSSTTYTIFVCVISIAIFSFLFFSLTLYFFSTILSKKLVFIKKTIAKIVYRGFLTDTTKNIDFNLIDRTNSGYESLFTAMKIKIINVKETEDMFSYFSWGNTRPKDKFHFHDWVDKIYPLNLYSNTLMDWRKNLSDIRQYQ